MKPHLFTLAATVFILTLALFTQAQTQNSNGIIYTYDAAGNRIHRAPEGSGERRANPNPDGKNKKEKKQEEKNKEAVANNLQATFTPNPTTSGNFNVTVSRNASQQTENPEIFVYNPLGELIQHKIAQYDNPVYIDLSSLSKGVYLVKVQSGEDVVMKKVAYQ